MPQSRPVPFFDLTRQYRLIESDLLERIRAFLPTQALTGGPEVEGFEARARDYLGAAHAVAISNGTDALLVALTALGVGPGDEVVVPAYTFFSTASVVARLGARPVFVDVDPVYYNADPTAVEAAIGPRTRAVMPVHLYGQACDLGRIAPACDRAGVPLVEDAAQAFGATWRDHHCGAVGRMGCFSFYPTKNIGALGEGGLITARDAADAARVRALRNHGQEARDTHAFFGGNFRLASIQCLTLDVKLARVEDFIGRRRAHARHYHERLAGAGDLALPAAAPEGLHTYNQFVVRTARRDALRDHLAAVGIGCAVYYARPVPHQPAFASFGHREGEFPVSERASRETLALPIFPELEEAEVAEVCGAVRAFFDGVG